MEVKAHFSNIHTTILGCLSEAKHEIVAAVAWFTDREIFDRLCKQSALGVSVSVALIDDEINRSPGGLNFQKMRDLGGQVFLVPPGSRDEPLMHHKFCVIDAQTVITGSYNWSHKARTNDENITVVSEAPMLAGQYLDAFHDLVNRYQPGARSPADTGAARRRLDLIRNLVLLGEHEGIEVHARKLRAVSAELKMRHILDALDRGKFTVALEQIDAYLSHATAIALAGQAEIPLLKLQLQAMELRLEALSNEKGEMERRLVIFNRQHDAALGELIERLLAARAELAELRAEVSAGEGEEAYTRAQAQAEEADQRFREYSEQHHALIEAAPVPMLDAQSERELKALYRKACALCHPDKVADAQKTDAHAAFVALQEAYRCNDLPGVREIYQTLKAGRTLNARSALLSEFEALQAAIAQMEHKISALVGEFKALRDSDAGRLMESVHDWEAYIDARRRELEAEIEQTAEEIARCREAEVDG